MSYALKLVGKSTKIDTPSQQVKVRIAPSGADNRQWFKTRLRLYPSVFNAQLMVATGFSFHVQGVDLAAVQIQLQPEDA